ncbi:hypothetical protein [Microtetraspora niveoalba]|uniref:hypothetical protein n=1 Tax=Microtetraspora niveoalba TaxID=46175 RepID=UPI00082C787A|nr:hypothetical protein [Microtetraspora niveoalba]
MAERNGQPRLRGPSEVVTREAAIERGKRDGRDPQMRRLYLSRAHYDPPFVKQVIGLFDAQQKEMLAAREAELAAIEREAKDCGLALLRSQERFRALAASLNSRMIELEGVADPAADWGGVPSLTPAESARLRAEKRARELDRDLHERMSWLSDAERRWERCWDVHGLLARAELDRTKVLLDSYEEGLTQSHFRVVGFHGIWQHTEPTLADGWLEDREERRKKAFPGGVLDGPVRFQEQVRSALAGEQGPRGIGRGDHGDRHGDHHGDQGDRHGDHGDETRA